MPLLIIIFLGWPAAAFAEQRPAADTGQNIYDACVAEADSLWADAPQNGHSRVRRPIFLTLKNEAGTVFQTKDFVRGDYRIPLYSSHALKLGMMSLGNTWQDIAYGMPYYGLGLFGYTNFGRRPEGYQLGNPYSVYLLQGATLLNIGRRMALNYEWNIGVAFGWTPFDPFDNPYNECIGSEVNVHVGINLYLKWMLSRTVDLHLGVDATHFSNGVSRLPNAGINMAAAYLELSVNFNRKSIEKEYNPSLIPPLYNTHFSSDFSVIASSRTSRAKIHDTNGAVIPNMYIDRSFKVLGFSYAFMRNPSYRYRYGLSADLIYDEGAGVRAWREMNVNGYEYTRIKKGTMQDRFQLGISAKGEVILPGYTIFAHLGLDYVNGNKENKRFYQIFGAKIYLKENFFGTFGIRAQHFSRAQFLFWSLGYTIDHKSRR